MNVAYTHHINHAYIRTAAGIISRVCEPVVLLLLIVIMTLVRAGIDGGSFIRTLFVIVIGIVLPPILALLIALRKKKISNWDMSNRPERVRALVIFCLFMVVDFFIIKMLSIAALSQLFLFLLFVFIGFFLITLFWKISGHMTVATMVICILIHWFGLTTSWYLFGIIPLLAWSRITLKRHTVAQVIGGILYGAAMVWVFILT